MRSRIVSIFIIFVFLAALFSCSSVPQEHKGAATGAGVGAATGAVAGGLIGGGVRGAAIGGLLGALAGGAVGHYGYDTKRSATETAQAYNYQPASGTVLRIENAAASPATVQPGQNVDLKMTYAVLNPSPAQQVNVTETREIRFGNEVVGKPQVNVQRGGGTYTSTVPLTLPATAQKGTYTVISTVQAGGVTDTKQSTFNVG